MHVCCVSCESWDNYKAISLIIVNAVPRIPLKRSIGTNKSN